MGITFHYAAFPCVIVWLSKRTTQCPIMCLLVLWLINKNSVQGSRDVLDHDQVVLDESLPLLSISSRSDETVELVACRHDEREKRKTVMAKVSKLRGKLLTNVLLVVLAIYSKAARPTGS